VLPWSAGSFKSRLIGSTAITAAAAGAAAASAAREQA